MTAIRKRSPNLNTEDTNKMCYTIYILMYLYYVTEDYVNNKKYSLVLL